jgi:fructose-specific phosphotransferase system IIC component
MKHSPVRRRFLRRVGFVPLLLSGCSRAPAFDILGSQFPAWLICILAGIVLAVFSRWLLLRLKVEIVFPILVYPCLAAFFTFVLWLVFFG